MYGLLYHFPPQVWPVEGNNCMDLSPHPPFMSAKDKPEAVRRNKSILKFNPRADFTEGACKGFGIKERRMDDKPLMEVVVCKK